MICFFFFKQKTAYEMRISDWSSDVCSSDLRAEAQPVVQPAAAERADDAAHAERDQPERDPRFGQAGHLGHGRREVAEDAEHAGEADRADAQREPHRLAVEVAQLADRVLVRLVWIVRQ